MRAVIEDVRKQTKPHFVPSLLLVTWADGTAKDVAPDFNEMVEKLLKNGVIGDAMNFVVSATDKDLDEKFEEAVVEINLDFEDKTTSRLTWKGEGSHRISLMNMGRRETVDKDRLSGAVACWLFASNWGQKEAFYSNAKKMSRTTWVPTCS